MAGKREKVIRVLLDEVEQAELQAAADKAALPLAVWARQSLLLKAREAALKSEGG